MTIKSSSSSGGDPDSSFCSSAPEQSQFASLLLPAFRIVSQALVYEAFLLFSVDTSLRAGTSCGSAESKMHSWSKCGDVNATPKCVDRKMSFVGIVCMIQGRIKGVM